MKKIVSTSLLFLCLLGFAAAQALWNSPHRYVQMVFGPYKVTRSSNLVYTSSSVDINGLTNQFTCNISQPIQAFDPMDKRPVIVLVPGGGFANIDDDKYYMYESFFARMGYVVLKVNRYRLYKSTNYQTNENQATINSTKKDKNGKYSVYPGLCVYAAMQDVNAAIKYLVANENLYHIDRNKIFLFGESAGAMTVQALALTNNNTTPNEMVDLYNLQEYGDINYTTTPSYKNFSYKIVGVLPIAAALINDELLQPNDSIPMWMETNLVDLTYNNIMTQYNTAHPNSNNRSSKPYDLVIDKIKNMNLQGVNYPCSYLLVTTNGFFNFGSERHYMDPTLTDWQNIIRPMIGMFCRRIIYGNNTCNPNYYDATYRYGVYSTSSANARIGTDLDDEFEEVSLSVYPNPINSIVTLAGLDRTTTITVKAYDVLGNEVFIKEIPENSSNDGYELSLQGLPAGCYYLHIPNQKSTSVIKIMKVD